MDAFSEVLNGVRLKGAMFFRAEFSAPWRLSTPHCRALAPTLAPGAPHMLIYHFVVDGSARGICSTASPMSSCRQATSCCFRTGIRTLERRLRIEPASMVLRSCGRSRHGTFRRCAPVAVGRRPGSCVGT